MCGQSNYGTTKQLPEPLGHMGMDWEKGGSHFLLKTVGKTPVPEKQRWLK
jgi:hypothetical protein